MMSSQLNSCRSLRLEYFPFIWLLLLPIRIYLRFFPIQHGKGLLLKYCVVPLMPPRNASYQLSVSGNGMVCLLYRETLGLSSLLYGTFEKAELEFVSRYLKPGDIAFDIGANVGIFSVVIGIATGQKGRVVAVEPVPFNTQRLRYNLDLNGLRNVQILPVALGSCEDLLDINIAEDAAYHSFGAVEGPFHAVSNLTVSVRKLDHIWHEMGKPQVDLLKIDVEGMEDDVLSGGMECLKSCKPVVLVEANNADELERLKKRFFSIGFLCLKPHSFVAHNYLFYAPNLADNIRACLN